MAKKAEDDAETFRVHLDELHPLGHTGEPDTIAACIACLASNDAKFLTGSWPVIGGG